MPLKNVPIQKRNRQNFTLSRLFGLRKHSAKPAMSEAEKRAFIENLYSQLDSGDILEVDKTSYPLVVQDETRDVIVEFYEDNNKDCKTVEDVYRSIMDGYDRKQVVFVKCNINSGIDTRNVYSIPMIKLFPAQEKYLPLEYYPHSYSNAEGYKEFIKQEGSHKAPWILPSERSTPRTSTTNGSNE